MNRKRSKKKRSRRKQKSQKGKGRIIQKGGGFFNWYSSITKKEISDICDKALEVGQSAVTYVPYDNPNEYIVNVAYMLQHLKDNASVGKRGGIFKGIFSNLITSSAAAVAAMVATTSILGTTYHRHWPGVKLGEASQNEQEKWKKEIEINKKAEPKILGAGVLTFLATVYGIYKISKNKHTKQSKMILQTIADKWNKKYPNKPLKIDNIPKHLLKSDPISKKVIKNIEKKDKDYLEYLEEIEKIELKHQKKQEQIELLMLEDRKKINKKFGLK